MPHPNAWQPIGGELVYLGDLRYCGMRIPGAILPRPPTRFTLPSYSIDMSGKSVPSRIQTAVVAVPPAPAPKRAHLRLV